MKAVNQRQDFDKAWAQIANHKHQFTYQDDCLKLLEEITLDDFKQHFERVFFSASTARLDFALITEKHFADNEKIDHEIFKLLKRVDAPDSIIAYQKGQQLFKDAVKSEFIK